MKIKVHIQLNTEVERTLLHPHPLFYPLPPHILHVNTLSSTSPHLQHWQFPISNVKSSYQYTVWTEGNQSMFPAFYCTPNRINYASAMCHSYCNYMIWETNQDKRYTCSAPQCLVKVSNVTLNSQNPILTPRVNRLFGYRDHTC